VGTMSRSCSLRKSHAVAKLYECSPNFQHASDGVLAYHLSLLSHQNTNDIYHNQTVLHNFFEPRRPFVPAAGSSDRRTRSNDTTCEQ
jgi:hypothetical protein